MLSPTDQIRLADQTSESEKRDAPDLVIVLENELVVCEGKFFDDFSSASLDAQLSSQRRQIRHLLAHQGSLQAYRQVALLPDNLASPPDCDVVVTWTDIAALAAEVLGYRHYVTARLRAAVERWKAIHSPRPGLNYDGTLPLDAMLDRCRKGGQTIHVGFSGGVQALLAEPLTYLERRPWRWRNPLTNPGVTIRKNWIPGTQFVELIEHRRSEDVGTIRIREEAACNCLCSRQ